MSRKLISLSVVATLLGGTTMADVPNVVADIAPVHSLVARVMEGVGTPDLILPPGASPHEYSLRPSEASALQEADMVVWMGPRLAPWMEGALATLAENADVLTLLEADETMLLEVRENALFEKHSHEPEDHPEDGHEDHVEGGQNHEHKDEHDHEEHAEGESHDHHHEERSHDDHNHADGEYDPHAWLSPANAATWLNLIAAKLSAADPENAGSYFANAASARAEMEALFTEVKEILEPVRGGGFIVFHDAFQYFETDFDLPASGAISLSDAQDPSPTRITEVQERIRDEGINCVLAEPQFNQGLVSTVLDGTNANTAVIDPIGVDLEPGQMLYPQLIRNLASTLAKCM